MPVYPQDRSCKWGGNRMSYVWAFHVSTCLLLSLIPPVRDPFLSCISSLPVSDPEGFLDSPQPLVDLHLWLYSDEMSYWMRRRRLCFIWMKWQTERKTDDETTSLLSINFPSSHAALLDSSPDETSSLVSIPTGGTLQAAHSIISSYQREENERMLIREKKKRQVWLCEYLSDFESP